LFIFGDEVEVGCLLLLNGGGGGPEHAFARLIVASQERIEHFGRNERESGQLGATDDGITVRITQQHGGLAIRNGIAHLTTIRQVPCNGFKQQHKLLVRDRDNIRVADNGSAMNPFAHHPIRLVVNT
jgi:hypothetical protein